MLTVCAYQGEQKQFTRKKKTKFGARKPHIFLQGQKKLFFKLRNMGNLGPMPVCRTWISGSLWEPGRIINRSAPPPLKANLIHFSVLLHPCSSYVEVCVPPHRPGRRRAGPAAGCLVQQEAEDVQEEEDAHDVQVGEEALETRRKRGEILDAVQPVLLHECSLFQMNYVETAEQATFTSASLFMLSAHSTSGFQGKTFMQVVDKYRKGN